MEALQETFENEDGGALDLMSLFELGSLARLLQIYEVCAISLSSILRENQQVDLPLRERILALSLEHTRLYRRISMNLDEASFMHYIAGHQRVTAILLAAGR